jgi:hypothetical protein
VTSEWWFYSQETIELDDVKAWLNACPDVIVASCSVHGEVLRTLELTVSIVTMSEAERIALMAATRDDFGVNCPPEGFFATTILCADEENDQSGAGKSLLWLAAYPALRSGFITKESRGYRYFDAATGWQDTNWGSPPRLTPSPGR